MSYHLQEYPKRFFFFAPVSPVRGLARTYPPVRFFAWGPCSFPSSAFHRSPFAAILTGQPR